MSAPIKTKEELTRMAWLTELRRQGHRQCVGVYFDGEHACAIGLLAEVAGIDRSTAARSHSEDIGSVAGLTMGQTHGVVERNDGELGFRKHTFAEIADVVDGWFKGN